jgi:hypothetical protein
MSGNTMTLIAQAAEHSLRDMSLASFRVGDERVTVVPRFSLPQPLQLMTTSMGPFYPDVPTDVPLWIAILLRKRNLVRIVAPTWMTVEHLTHILNQERGVVSGSGDGDGDGVGTNNDNDNDYDDNDNDGEEQTQNQNSNNNSYLQLSNQLPMHYMEMAHALLTVTGGYTNSGGTMTAFVSSETQGIDGIDGGGGAAAHHEGSSSSACDIDRAPEVIMLLSDIESIRLDKLRSKLHGLSHNELSAAFTTDEEGRMVPNPEKSAENLIMDASRIGHLELLQLAPFLKETFRVHGELSGAPKTNAHHVLEQDDRDAEAAEAQEQLQQQQEQGAPYEEDDDTTPRPPAQKEANNAAKGVGAPSSQQQQQQGQGQDPPRVAHRPLRRFRS